MPLTKAARARYLRRWRAAKKAAGICLCGDPLGTASGMRCAPCLAEMRERNKALRTRRILAGQCADCRDFARPGKSRCELHLKRHRAQSLRYYLEHK